MANKPVARWLSGSLLPDLSPSISGEPEDDSNKAREDPPLRAIFRQLRATAYEVLDGPSEGAEQTERALDVEHYDNVRRLPNRLRHTINDPCLLGDQLSLRPVPLGSRRLDPAALPNNGVQGVDRQAEHATELDGKCSLARASVACDVDAHEYGYEKDRTVGRDAIASRTRNCSRPWGQAARASSCLRERHVALSR